LSKSHKGFAIDANLEMFLPHNTASPKKLRSSDGVDDSLASFYDLILTSVSETPRT
jgi:hypothetical protein